MIITRDEKRQRWKIKGAGSNLHNYPFHYITDVFLKDVTRESLSILMTSEEIEVFLEHITKCDSEDTTKYPDWIWERPSKEWIGVFDTNVDV